MEIAAAYPIRFLRLPLLASWTRIVDPEQAGDARAQYDETPVRSVSESPQARIERGFQHQAAEAALPDVSRRLKCRSRRERRHSVAPF